MDDADPTTELIRRWHGGDRDAFDQLFAHYARRLARVAEHHLNRKLAVRVDQDDIVQSVFRTFFRRATEGELRISSSAHLWRLLVQMTVLKTHARWRKHTAQRRDLRAEADDGEGWLEAASSAAPGPEEAAALVDLLEATVRGLEPVHVAVLDRLVVGQSVAEIAEALGRTRQSIYRIRDLLEDRLRKAAGEDG
jgi:RNA polymerase sigma-70 factor (ECF subfamily)